MSTAGQDPAAQVGRLVEHGCERVWMEYSARFAVDRPELGALLAYARPGDQLVVTRLDRLGDIRALIPFEAELERRQLGLAALDHNIDTQTAYGRGALHMLAVLAQIESEVRRERQLEAWAAGKQKGRPLSLTAAQIVLARRLSRVEGLSAARIAESIGTSASTIKRVLREDRQHGDATDTLVRDP